MRTIQAECLDRMILFGQASLDRAIASFVEHHHTERNHLGLGNRLVEERELPTRGRVVRDQRLGGLLSFYRRAA